MLLLEPLTYVLFEVSLMNIDLWYLPYLIVVMEAKLDESLSETHIFIDCFAIF